MTCTLTGASAVLPYDLGRTVKVCNDLMSSSNSTFTSGVTAETI